jgi:hypothetical protein
VAQEDGQCVFHAYLDAELSRRRFEIHADGRRLFCLEDPPLSPAAPRLSLYLPPGEVHFELKLDGTCSPFPTIEIETQIAAKVRLVRG